MPSLVFLGTSNAIPDETHANTFMAVVARDQVLLIDCAENALVRLRQAGVDFNLLTDIILTHFHPDHVGGIPSLLMNLWLLGRKEPITLHGLAHTLDRMEKVMDFYDWASWPNLYPIHFHRLDDAELSPLLSNQEVEITSSPVCHLIPTIGLRFLFKETGRVLAYSCDTSPCAAVVKLGQKADVLIHEAAGASPGHSSPGQAGETASQAQARSLYLIHYPTNGSDSHRLLSQAKTTFSGPIALAEDLMVLQF